MSTFSEHIALGCGSTVTDTWTYPNPAQTSFPWCPSSPLSSDTQSTLIFLLLLTLLLSLSVYIDGQIRGCGDDSIANKAVNLSRLRDILGMECEFPKVPFSSEIAKF